MKFNAIIIISESTSNMRIDKPHPTECDRKYLKCYTQLLRFGDSICSLRVSSKRDAFSYWISKIPQSITDMSSPTDTTSDVQENSEEKPAQFFLYTRPLKDLVLHHADNVEFQHWVLVAVFSDKSIRAIEGIQSGEVIVPNFLKEWPPSNSQTGTFWQLIPLKISPQKLQEVAMNNSSNGTSYDLVNNNCQHWVKSAAEAISSELANSLDTFDTSDKVPIVLQGILAVVASSKAVGSSLSGGTLSDDSTNVIILSALLKRAEHGWRAVEQ